MSTQADRLRERMESMKSRREAAKEPANPGETNTEAKAKPGQRPKVSSDRATDRTVTVRRSLDLSPRHHRALTEWCADTAAELGVARVTGADALRMLVARLLTDETLARKIRTDLAEDFADRN